MWNFFGVTDGLVRSVIGLVVGAVINGVYYSIKNKDVNIGFALASYLGFGCMFVYIVERMVV